MNFYIENTVLPLRMVHISQLFVQSERFHSKADKHWGPSYSEVSCKDRLTMYCLARNKKHKNMLHNTIDL